jgi:hypothetical protein
VGKALLSPYHARVFARNLTAVGLPILSSEALGRESERECARLSVAHGTAPCRALLWEM